LVGNGQGVERHRATASDGDGTTTRGAADRCAAGIVLALCC